MIFVLTPLHREYVQWCRDRRHNPRGRDVRHIASPRDARGFKITGADSVVDLGADYDTWIAMEMRRA